MQRKVQGQKQNSPADHILHPASPHPPPRGPLRILRAAAHRHRQGEGPAPEKTNYEGPPSNRGEKQFFNLSGPVNFLGAPIGRRTNVHTQLRRHRGQPSLRQLAHKDDAHAALAAHSLATACHSRLAKVDHTLHDGLLAE